MSGKNTNFNDKKIRKSAKESYGNKNIHLNTLSDIMIMIL